VEQIIPVTAAVIQREDKVLIGRRRTGHFAGRWEFPGGKIEAGETPQACLKRELTEELGVESAIGPFLISTIHAYSHGTIELLTYGATIISGEPSPRDHSELRWVSVEDLRTYDFPEADRPVIEKLAAEGLRALL
jgi:8-oxo-dGTP diphosphatase